MDRLLARLERRFGGLAIENLTMFIVGGMAIVFMLSLAKPQFAGALTLDFAAIRRGEVWRLITYLFLPRTDSLLWIVFSLMFFWMMGTSLEGAWGSFKFNAYYFIGMLGTTLGAFLAHGSAGNEILNWSILFAFATVFPDHEILLFFVVPVRVKWLALLTAGLFLYGFIEGSWATRAAVIAALSNYFLFFGGHLVDLLRRRRTLVRQASRRESMRAPPPSIRPGPLPPASVPPPSGSPALANMGHRQCAICGALEEEGADIRVCSCEKCGGVPRNLCLAHARSH